MKPSLQAGLSLQRTLVVDRERTIDFMGEDGRVYATPMLVHDIEHCCRDLILEHLDDGEDSVGTAISVQHTAATLLGMNVTVTVTIAAVEGRLVRLGATAEDDVEPIGSGSHTRFVVDRGKTIERLKAKRLKFTRQGADQEAAAT